MPRPRRSSPSRAPPGSAKSVTIGARSNASRTPWRRSAPRRVFLTQGRLQLGAFASAPQHVYVVRAIDPLAGIARLPQHRLILARGPFSLDDEIALMRDEAIEILVSKNSGGAATYAKIEAARRLGVKVVMLERPPSGGVPALHDLASTLRWIEAHRPAP